MSNKELAKIFYEMADYLEMAEEAFKPQAYEKVSEVLENLEEDVKDIYKNGDLKALENIPGVGASIAEHIEGAGRTWLDRCRGASRCAGAPGAVCNDKKVSR